jgi:hypothetical protein
MANGDTPIPVTGQPSGAGAIQNLSSLLTQPQQQAAVQTSDQAPAQRDLSKEPQFIVHATHYGYQGDSTPDPNSQKGIGAWNNQLTGGTSIALTPDLEQRFGAQPGEHFVFTDRNGAQHDFTFGDRTSSALRGRIDVYDPTGQIGDLGEGTISRPGASGPAIPALETSNTEIQKQPAAFGMRVGTQDDVKNYNTYIQNGGDPEQIPIYDRLAVAIAKNPGFLSDPKNFEAFYGLVYQPLQQQNGAEQFNKAIMNFGPSLVQTLQNVGQGLSNMATIAPDEAELAFRKATGLTHDPGYQTVENRLATKLATQAQGTGQAIGDAWNFVTGVANGLVQTTRPLSEMFTTDPQSKDQVDRVYAHAMQTTVAGQQALANLGNQIQDLSANAYKSTGAFADLGQKIQTAQPNEAAAQGIAAVANPLNYIGVGAGEAAVGAFKPLFFEKGMQALEDTAGANARKLVLDSSQMMPDNPALSAANPGYIETRNLQSQFAGAARNATQDANDAANTLNQQLTSYGKISGDVGTPTWFMSQALQGTGTALDTVGSLARKASAFPEWIGNKIAGGNPLFAKIIKSGVEKTLFGAGLEMLGPVGGMVEAGMEHLPEIADATSDLFKTAGKELMYGESTIPYWTRVAQQTDAMPKFLAAALDSPAVQTATQIAKGGVAGAATGAVLGGLQQAGSVPGGGIAGAVGGAGQGGLLGMAGGGLGQWMRYQDSNQYLLQARGDWKRYRDMLPPQEQANFGKLSPTNQLVLAQSAHAFPGLKVNYTNDPTGPQGFHFFDVGNRSNIQINLANQDSVVRGIMAHELIHGATHSGMLPDLYDSLFGNPQTGQTGQFTALDAQGKPIGVNPATSRYFVNQEFTNLANHYTNLMAQNGLPTAHINDMTIAKEIYAEHGADYLLSGAPILDSNSAFRPGLLSRDALKTAMGKMGYTFDDSGRIVGGPGGGPPPQPGGPQTVRGTGLFPGLQRIPALDNLAHSYFSTGWREGHINSEEQPTHRFTKQDMQNPNVPETWLTNSAEIQRRQDGSVVRDPNTGLPIYRTPKEVENYNATFAQAVRTGLDTLPEDQRADLGIRQTVDDKGRQNTFMRYLPDNILDSLAATNQYNPHQIASLRMVSRVLADKGNPGMEMRLFYHKALTAGKTYRGFEGTEKIAVPYGIEVSGDNNVNIQSVDFNQLTNNYLRVRNRAPFKTLWNAPDDFAQDAHTYFVNHSQGRPGSNAIGEQKRDAINSLANFGTQLQREANPLVDTLPTAVRPIIKSYRIDRANQISATGAVRPFISEEQYYKMNRNYLPFDFRKALLGRETLGDAAIRFNDKNPRIYTDPESHSNAIGKAINAGENLNRQMYEEGIAQQGFITNKGRFVTHAQVDELRLAPQSP